MAPSRFSLAAAAAAAATAGLAVTRQVAFLVPAAAAPGAAAAAAMRRGEAPSVEVPSAAGWGLSSVAGVALGAHVGIAVAMASRAARRAAEGKGKEVATKYVESATDQKLFEQVYTDYTIEYLKGPMYWHEDKLQGVQAGYAGEPMQMNKRLTSNNLGNLKTFSSNELAFLAFLFFGIGLYGNLMFWIYDPQFLNTALGNDFNVSYIVESFFLPMSFFFHIGCWIQRRNGK